MFFYMYGERNQLRSQLLHVQVIERRSSNQTEAVALLFEAEFSTLDQRLQDLIVACSQGEEGLKKFVSSDGQLTRSTVILENQKAGDHTTTTHEEQEKLRSLVEKRERLLNSLKDADMKERKIK